MKRIVLVILALALLPMRFVFAQDHAKARRFIDALKPARAPTVPESSTTPASSSAKEKIRAANFKRHFEQVARWRAQGKSAAEIHNMLGANLAAAGTGKITGMIYQSNGVTPIEVYTSVTAYDEFGRYAGFGFTSGSAPYTFRKRATSS